MVSNFIVAPVYKQSSVKGCSFVFGTKLTIYGKPTRWLVSGPRSTLASSMPIGP